MAKLVFGMHQSLDGYVDHKAFAPIDITLFRYFIKRIRDVAGGLYGSHLYEIMRYWDEDLADWEADEHEFAALWRKMPKWVVSGSLDSVGANATLLKGDLETEIRALKAGHAGEIDVGGPDLAASLGALGLIDEYRIYLHPIVLGGGKRFFTKVRPRLRLVGSDRIGEDVIRLTYVPA